MKKKKFSIHRFLFDWNRTLEYQREVLENASSNKEVLDAMGQASKAFKGANGNMDVDKIHDLMDDMAEQNQIASEISTAISNPVGFDQEVDEVTKYSNCIRHSLFKIFKTLN